jgi:uncharacterized protein (DUF1697 family)
VTAYIALLRGINVGGHAQVAMADLRSLLDDLGFENPRSLLNSGNLVFDCPPRRPARLERTLETETKKRLALAPDYFVRTGQEWKTIIAGNPYRAEAKRDPGHLVVMFLKDAPAAKPVKDLRAAIVGREVLRVTGRHAYIHYPDGQGTSRLTNTLIEKKLGTRGTARNWNTVLKLNALVNG